ncbi:hypothetical protein ACQ4LE_010705 [Meloidogyne hapla]
MSFNEPVYVRLVKSLDEGSDIFGIQTEMDGSLLIQNLDFFNGVYALQYKHQATGTFRFVRKDPTETKFYPPPSGWEDKEFLVVQAA